MHRSLHFLAIAVPAMLVAGPSRAAASLQVAGVTVNPHVQSDTMRYRREPDRSLGARVQIYLRNAGTAEVALPDNLAISFRGQSPDELLRDGRWAWHDTPAAWPGTDLRLPPGAMTVWQFNSRDAEWGVDTKFELAAGGSEHLPPTKIAIEAPRRWISAATFLADGESIYPNRLVVHMANESGDACRITGCRLWLPADNATWRVLLPGSPLQVVSVFPPDGPIASGDKGGVVLRLPRLPLSYTAVELQCATAAGESRSLWAHLRVKRESFDVSGGWVASNIRGRSTLEAEPFLKTLKRMHINTAHIADAPGYTDQTGPGGLYSLYPLKYFNKLEPLSHYDNDALLPRIHAVEFLGEPQYGGGRPVPPMEVWRQLAPYQATRLPTSITHSEERVWRYYAGLSDYPHYDAYRVSAPSPDAWSKYDRWRGQVIRWGAPLETIGEMSRSLRELNRPLPTAYWSQGPHSGWDAYGGRRRTSPTAEELRLQAYHALSSRITSLYWFNLSLASLVKFPDLIDEVTRVGREMRLLDQLYLEGDAYHYQQVRRDGALDWDLATLAGPRAAVLFALDLDYAPDPQEKVFRFAPPRAVTFRFRLPRHLRSPTEVFRIDADGVYPVDSQPCSEQIEINDRASQVAVYVVSPGPGLQAELEAKRQELLRAEAALDFDPAHREADLAQLRAILGDGR